MQREHTVHFRCTASHSFSTWHIYKRFVCKRNNFVEGTERKPISHHTHSPFIHPSIHSISHSLFSVLDARCNACWMSVCVCVHIPTFRKFAFSECLNWSRLIRWCFLCVVCVCVLCMPFHIIFPSSKFLSHPSLVCLILCEFCWVWELLSNIYLFCCFHFSGCCCCCYFE